MKTKPQILIAGLLLATVATGFSQPATFTKVTGQPIAEDHGVSVGGSWADYDKDGYPDCYVVNLSGGINSLYHNNHDGTFTKILTNALLNLPSGWSAVWGDYDNDNDLDIFVPADGAIKDSLMRNEGSGVFFKMPPYAGGPTDDTQTTFGGSWADVDRDGWLDLFVGCYGRQNDRLFRNLGNGTFRRLTAAEAGDAVADAADTCAGSWADYDNDGYPDLFVQLYEAGTGSGKHFLYHNDGTGRLLLVPATDFPRLNGSYRLAAWGDYDNDGYFDLFESGYDVRSALYHNNRNGTFTNLAVNAGFGTPLAGAMGAAWGDYDNDGDLDLFVTTYNGRNALYQNKGDGTFKSIDVGSPLADGAGRVDAGWVDYDRDGFLDLFIGCQSSVNGLYHNNLQIAGNTNHWLEVQLKGTASNVSAIGAKIRIKAVIGGAEVWLLRQVESSFFTHDLVVHFGLGDATNVDLVRIEWPSGNVQELSAQTANLIVPVIEQSDITPTRPTASLGGSVTLTLSRTCTQQWYHEGVPLEGQTGQTLHLTNIGLADGGRYSVVTTCDGIMHTNFVYLYVDTQFTKINTGSVVTDTGMCPAVSSGDYDGDGYADLFVVRYKLGSSAVYGNNRDGTFTRVLNLPFGKQSNEVGVWGDLNNDGSVDLLHELLGSEGEPSLSASVYFNKGDATFTANQRVPIPSFGNRSLVDFNNDGFLDVYYCRFAQNRLYRNNGDRTFTLMTASAVGPIASLATFGGACWADFNDDGWPDLYAPHYQGNQSRMFRNDGTGRFVAVTNLVTRTAAPVISGAWGDYDNDEKLDLCVAAFNGTSVVYRNLGNGDFERPAGTPTLTGSHNFAAWVDYDNDGFLDLFISGYMSGNKLFHNNGDGTFARITTGSIVNELPLRGAGSYAGLWFDYDNDGFLDLYVINGDDVSSIPTANQLYHNNGNSNAWLRVKLLGTVSNRDAVGAKVRVQATYAGQSRWQRRDISAGDEENGNHLTADFGLGNATVVDKLRIEWPSGITEEFTGVVPRQILTIVEPSLRGTLGGDAKFHLYMTMSTNRPYCLETSSNLVSWTALTNCMGSGSCAAIEYVDPEAPAAYAARFYRMR